MRSVISRLGLPTLTSATGLSTAGMCSAGPAMLAGPLTTAILGGSAWMLHLAVGLLLAPVSLLLLFRSFVRHRQMIGLVVAGAGVLLMVVHYASHFHQGTHGDEPLIYLGAGLLMAGALLDWYAQRRALNRPAHM